MTRTHAPDILASTLYGDFPLNPLSDHSISLHSSRQCDLKMIDKPEIVNKRHCRSFDFIESLDEPQSLASSMEYPYKRQHTTQDKTSHLTWSDSKKRTRSRSAPRFKSTLTAVPISVSPLGAGKGRDGVQTASDTFRTSETHGESYSSNKAFLNEVHPIKLQPQTPLYVSDCFEEGKPDKPAITPHVRCRVDIKPDAAVLQHASRQIVSSPTPTASECYSGDFRQGYHYTTSMSPISYQHVDTHRMPSPTAPYLSQDQRAYSNPNIPTKFFYTEDPIRYQVHPYSRTYFQDDREPAHSVYSRPYSTSESGSYFSQTPLSRPYYREDNQSNPYYMSNSRLFYSKPCSPEEQYFPSRPYHTEGRRRPRMSQAFSDDWYRSSISGYSNQSSQHTPPRVNQDPSLPPWFTNSCLETGRLGAEVRNHSKSWDNILHPRYERQQSVPRGRSYENLFHQAKHAAPSDIQSQPVILNLSSSPRRYAALSLSESSLERGSSNPWGNTKSGHWFVTPEITITDNDINAVMPHKQSQNAQDITKERKHNNFSLQQSLEQLDELLADLVVDYKPPTSRKSSVDLLDQLKMLITTDDNKDRGCPNKQLPSSKSSPDTIKDPDSGFDALQRSAEECSPDHSTDDDDTMVCANKKCNRIETMFNACLYFKSCHSCYTFYCSRNCRRDDWEIHKETCLYGRVNSVCRRSLKFCRENAEIHKAFSRVAKAGYLSRGRGVLFLGFANPETADNFLQVGLESLLMSPTYLSLRELDGFKDNLGEYCKELQQAGDEYDPDECFLLNVSVAVGELVPNRPSPRVPAPTVRKYAKVSLASSSPDKKVLRKDSEMETLILTPPPGTPDIDKEGEEGRKAREVCFVNIQRELRTRGVFLRHENPRIYNQLCEFVESNKRFTPTTIYPIDKRTGKQFMCMIMAASEPRTLDWVRTPHLLDDII
uniref:Un-named hu7912 n=1 Tax=Gasterosteus aculeatus TaxID=69293 RepID=G3PE14_GASAC